MLFRSVMSISLQASRSRIIRENALSKEEIMEKAGSYGMILGKEEEDAVNISKNEDNTENKDDATTEEDSIDNQDTDATKEDNTEEQEKLDTDNADKNEQGETVEDDNDTNKEDTSSNNSIVSIDYVPITVTSGMTATSVSTYLKKEGIIEDSDEFRVYLTEQGYASKIGTGEYLIPIKSAYQKIADIITRKNTQ